MFPAPRGGINTRRFFNDPHDRDAAIGTRPESALCLTHRRRLRIARYLLGG